jgi:uncharacterized protein (TIGR02757 family)
LQESRISRQFLLLDEGLVVVNRKEPVQLVAGKRVQKPSKTPTRRLEPSRQEAVPVDWAVLRPALDALVQQYKTPAYIDNDPIQLPYRYLDDPKAVELIAFITALFSYGRREWIITSLNPIFRRMGPNPIDFLEAFDPKRDARHFRDFVHRFNTGADLLFLLERLQWAYDRFGSLEALFAHSLSLAKETELTSGKEESILLASQAGEFLDTERFKLAIGGTIDQLLGPEPPERYGLRFMLAHPARGGACKRFNMFLRWMVRQDEEPSGRVDFGLWRTALSPRDLRMPLDAHVMNMNRQLRFSPRKDGSWKTAEEITAVLRHLCPEDPVKYDYALFGFSLDKRALSEIVSQV